MKLSWITILFPYIALYCKYSYKLFEHINYHKSDTPKDVKLAFVNISGIVVTRASALAVVSVRALRT